MRVITLDDLLDVYLKMVQRGAGFLLSKLNPNTVARTRSAFSDSAFQSSNWWIIPEIRERWNEKITGDRHERYESYLHRKYLADIDNLKMLSVGSGVCSHEIAFAKYPNFEKVVCVDLADNLLRKAEQRAQELKLNNLEFLPKDINDITFEASSFDVVLFNSSLHHISHVEHMMVEKIIPLLKPKGLVIINEYVGVNRLQFPERQIKSINQGIRMIPEKYRSRYKSSMIKSRYYGSGILRMIVADPSECVESANILPVMKNYFHELEIRPYGGNLLMSILKDISHNFIDSDNQEAMAILHKLFNLEDSYLLQNKSDFVFGVYRKL